MNKTWGAGVRQNSPKKEKVWKNNVRKIHQNIGHTSVGDKIIARMCVWGCYFRFYTYLYFQIFNNNDIHYIIRKKEMRRRRETFQGAPLGAAGS